jgi:hypothetical protein
MSSIGHPLIMKWGEENVILVSLRNISLVDLGYRSGEGRVVRVTVWNSN